MTLHKSIFYTFHMRECHLLEDFTVNYCLLLIGTFKLVGLHVN